MLRVCVTFVVLNSILNFCSGVVKNTQNIAVIGTGPSGLVSAKYAIEQGFNVTVFEQNEALGGVWWYTEEVGKNKYGIDIHTSMYKGLRTNVPIQMMEYSDHVYGRNIIPFPQRKDIWHYLNSYAIRFDVKQQIKFNHLVTDIEPIDGGKWKVEVKDLLNNKLISNIFDAVVVCNGHNSLPHIPKFKGVGDFSGKILHSHDFRDADAYSGQNVLVIGSGSSGIDLVALLSKTANHVTWSRRSNALSFPYENVIYKGEIKRFTRMGVEFADGTEDTFSVIFCATGYNFTFPFLSNSSDITVNDNFVQPLYKQIFNIEHPTMLFIGIPSGLLPTFPSIEHQIRFALKFLTGEKSLPSKDEMIKDMQSQIEIHWNRHKSNRSSQYFELEHRDYYKELSDIASIESPPVVISSIYLDNDAMRKADPTTFRKYRFIIIDDERYIKKKYEN